MEDKLILDIGSGAIPHGNIQIDLPVEESAKHHGGKPSVHPTIYADAHYLPFKDNVIDRVLMCHSLEHLHCPFYALLEVKRVLKNDGLLRIEIPNPRCWNHERMQHLYSWHPDTLINIVREAGFNQIRYYPHDSESEKNQAVECSK